MDLATIPARYLDRFRERVDRSGGPDECWVWMGTINSSGYGHLAVGHATALAHRVAHFVATGDQPENVCHRCDNPPCCNPAHLFGGTRADNQHDKGSKGRAARGASNGGGGKLTEDDVRAIRRRLDDGESQRAVARAFGVSQPQIGHIARGTQWAHVR